MTIGLLVLVGVTIIGFLVAQDRRDKRAHEERHRYRLEIADFCQRLQNPGAAVAQHAVQHMPAGDDAFPLTDEQVAEMQERQAAVARIEALENGTIDGLGIQ